MSKSLKLFKAFPFEIYFFRIINVNEEESKKFLPKINITLNMLYSNYGTI